MNRFFDVIGGNPTVFLQKTFQNIKNNSKKTVAKQVVMPYLCVRKSKRIEK